MREMGIAPAQCGGDTRYYPKSLGLAAAAQNHRPKAAEQHRKSRRLRDNLNPQIVDVAGIGVQAQSLPLKLQGEIAEGTQRNAAHIGVVQECGRAGSIHGAEREPLVGSGVSVLKCCWQRCVKIESRVGQ